MCGGNHEIYALVLHVGVDQHLRRPMLDKHLDTAALFIAQGSLTDERFCRMFEFYLAGSECAFRYQGHIVFQAQLSRSVAAVPPTRAYLYDAGTKPAAGLARAS